MWFQAERFKSRYSANTLLNSTCRSGWTGTFSPSADGLLACLLAEQDMDTRTTLVLKLNITISRPMYSRTGYVEKADWRYIIVPYHHQLLLRKVGPCLGVAVSINTEEPSSLRYVRCPHSRHSAHYISATQCQLPELKTHLED